MRGATIAKVAQEAGVGVGTVSRVLNGSRPVSEATRRRVLDAIDALGYEPNAAARALSTGRTSALGVVAPFFTQPSVVERLRGVARALAGRGLPAGPLRRRAPGARPRPTLLRRPSGRIDGLLVVSLAPADAELRGSQAAGIPVVLVDRRAPAPAVGHHRRRRGRADGGRAPARARPPADRLRRRRRGQRRSAFDSSARRRSASRRAGRGGRAARPGLVAAPARARGRPSSRRPSCWRWPRPADGDVRRAPTCRRSACSRRAQARRAAGAGRPFGDRVRRRRAGPLRGADHRRAAAGGERREGRRAAARGAGRGGRLQPRQHLALELVVRGTTATAARWRTGPRGARYPRPPRMAWSRSLH